MGDVDVKQLMLQVDASVELLRQNLLRGDTMVANFANQTQRRMDATDRRFAQLGRPLNGIAATVTRTNAAIASIGGTVQRVERQIASSSAGIKTALLSSTAGIAAALSGRQVADYADSYTRFTNQLKVAGLEGQQLIGTQEQLYAIAQKFGVPLENLGQLYGGLASLQKDLNTTSADSVELTQAVAAGIKVGGVSAEKSAGAILGLNQALAQTRVQSDEYNQILDGARPLLQAAVDGTEKYSGSLAKLKQDIEAGNVSGSDLFRILQNGFEGINAKAEKATLTIGNSFVVLNNALGKYIGEAGEATSVTEKISAGIQGVANNLELIGPALAVIGAGFATRSILPGISRAATETELLVKSLDSERLVMLSGKVAAAQKAQAVATAAQAEVSAIEATLAARRADAEQMAASLVLIERQRAEALQAQAAMRANAAAGFGSIGMNGAGADAARANQDLKAQIVTRRALAAVNAEIAVSETALAAAQTRSIAATTAATAATTAATLAARAGAAASKLFAGALTLIGGSVAGGAAVLAIGAIVGAIMLYRNSVEEARQRDAQFVESGKELSQHLRDTAQYASSAASGMTAVGSSAAGATSKFNATANAAGNLAGNLRQVAEEARRAAVELMRADEAKANADLVYYTARDQQNRGARAGRSETLLAMGGVAPAPTSADDAKADAYYSARISEARARQMSASNRRAQLEHAPWQNFTPGAAGERSRDLQIADNEQRVTRDLTIARQSGAKAQIADLQAQKFEIDQYKKYRKDGLSAEASSAQASKDAADFRHASGERAANVAGAAAARGTAAAKRQEEAAVRDAAADSRAYAAASRQADNDIAAARASLSGSAEERAAIERARIEAERINRDEEIASQGANGSKRFTQDEVRLLQAKNAQRAELEKEVVDLGERRRVAQETLDSTVAGLDTDREILEARAALVVTTAERRDLELRILDIQRQEEEVRLRAITVANGATAAEEKIAQARLAQLSQIYDLKRQQVDRNNESPMQRYRRESMEKIANYGENLETIEVRFFDNLNDQLAESATRFLKLKGAAGDFFNQLIADIIRLNIEQATGGAGGLLGGLMKIVGIGGGSAGAGGGGNIVLSNRTQAYIAGARASGGPVAAGKTYLVGEKGPELFTAPSNGNIVPNHTLASMRNGTFRAPSVSSGMLASSRGGGGGVVRIEVAEGAMFEPRVSQISGAVSATIMQAASPTLVSASVGASRSDSMRAGRRRIPGRG